MNKKRGKKSNRGRKPNRAVLSGSKPDQETLEEICCRFNFGSNEWPMVALRQLIATDQRQKIAPFMRKLIADCERAALDGDADWFRRQANAIEKGGSPQRAQFNAKVAHLFRIEMRKMWETLGLPENWRPLTDAERKAFPNLTRVPHVVTPTPAGKVTDAMASDIYGALEKCELPNGLLLVEGWHFENKERVMEAIHDLAKRLQFELKKQARKR